MDYSLCNYPVTLYRKQEEGVTRQVIDRAWISMEDGLTGREREPVRKFLLIVPGDKVRLLPGDRVHFGIGPTDIDWETFLPVYVPYLVEVSKVRNFQFNGKILHTEAE